jgi:hypothetical protein
MAKQWITHPAFNDSDGMPWRQPRISFPRSIGYGSRSMLVLFRNRYNDAQWGGGGVGNSKCPYFQHVREDKEHLLKCAVTDCADIWLNSLLGLEARMIETDTAPEIRDCLLQTLATWNLTQSFAAFSFLPEQKKPNPLLRTCRHCKLSQCSYMKWPHYNSHQYLLVTLWIKIDANCVMKRLLRQILSSSCRQSTS